MAVIHNPKIILSNLLLNTDAKDIISKSNLSNEQLEVNNIGYSNWVVGNTSATGFSINGSTDENEIVRITDDPWGNESVAWECRGQSENGPDGGWNGSRFDIDNTKTYRFTLWYRRVVQGTGSPGSFYLGTRGYDITASNIGVETLAGDNRTNPYFEITDVDQSDWALVVAHIHPSGYSGSTHSDTGVYLANGTKLSNVVTDFRWVPLNTGSQLRSYLFYNQNGQTIQQMMLPRVDVVDGSVPSLSDLTSGRAYGLKNGVNTTNYIQLKGGTKLTSEGLYFDGINDHAVLKPESDYEATSDFTISMWIKPETTIQNTFTALVSKWNSGSGGWQLFWHSSNYIYLYVDDGTTVSSNNGSGPSSLVAGNWYHIVATFKTNSTNSKIFINGVNYSANQSSKVGTNNNLAPTIAAQPGNTTYNNHCTIGKFDFYRRVLLDSEVITIYNNLKSRFS